LAAAHAAGRFKAAFLAAFPMPDTPEPTGPTAPIAAAASLREGAVLSEDTEAVAKKIA
jgi:hypothetical protein